MRMQRAFGALEFLSGQAISKGIFTISHSRRNLALDETAVACCPKPEPSRPFITIARRIERKMDAKENSDRYRAYEAECIRHAELAIDDATRRRLEGLAHQWHEFAERADGPNGRHRRDR
jgi:hypothetical protein